MQLPTIAELEAKGYEGIDADLETSLFEYGLIWLEQDGGEYRIVYGHDVDDHGNYVTFHTAHFNKSELTLEGYDWIDDENEKLELQETQGTPEFLYQIRSLHETENTFGTTYLAGVQILNHEQIDALETLTMGGSN